MSQWQDDTRQRLRALRRALHQPGPERDALLLLVKAAIATVLAWQFAVRVLDSPVPFYAPMAALLVVDRTMVRSLSASAQRIAAVVLGLSVAWVVATVFGVYWWTMFGVILVSLVIGRWSRLGDHGIQVPAMVLLSLITAKGTNEEFTYLTIVETIAGGVIGVATNAIVFAPLHLTKPRQRVSALARQVRELLDEMAEGLRGDWDAKAANRWYRRGSEIAEKAPFVIEDIRTGRESTRFNLRGNIRPADIDWEGYEHTVKTLRRMLWQATGIARTLVDAADERRHQPTPSESFLSEYADALGGLARAVSQFGKHDDEAAAKFDDGIRTAYDVLTRLREEVRTTPLEDPDEWPVYGSLISDSLRALAELEAARESAVVPTDTGSLRLPPASSPVWSRLRRQGRRSP
ncbi:FUSC family protein [Terrabacter tumescens]|uniref:FUSC family protein n=1 Tax=Terrabacter tumescens TaxID=60443 RepID=A0ABQ2HIZ4_9MICO|nr:aromatic acid exporter family protein [Terrabacter tumescens]GGM82454.1 FUSC family protein [Terrabacter tumescens]